MEAEGMMKVEPEPSKLSVTLTSKMPSHLELPRHLAASCWHLWTVAMETTCQAFYASHCLGAVLPQACFPALMGTLLPPLLHLHPIKRGSLAAAFLCCLAGLALRCLKYETFHASAQETL